MITERSSVSEMKYALLKLGCPNICVTARLAGNGVQMIIETSHPKITEPIFVERAFTLAEYLGGPMQPIYFEIHQRVLRAANT